jgi:alkylresorcinol/alkylpyrone synthase
MAFELHDHPCIAGVATALPQHRYGQEELAEVARALLPELSLETATLQRFFRRVGVRQRFLALSAQEYGELCGFGSRNDAWLRVAQALAERALRNALDRAHMRAQDISLLMTTTVTGLAVPSLDARLMNRLPFLPSTKRVPLFGLGCLAGVAGLARASEYLRAFPREAAAFLSVELCSLTVQKEDCSVANMISMGLFGDGAAAVVLLGAEHPRARELRSGRRCAPSILGSRAAFFADTERVMGWDMVDQGFKIVLSQDVPRLAQEHVPGLVDTLLSDHDLARPDVRAWLAHPGGPAVIDAVQRGLELPTEALQRTRTSLADVGNLSSASALFILEGYLREESAQRDEHALLLAMGPAFCAEAVLLAC